MKAYVGLDWSASEVAVSVSGEEGEPRPHRGVGPALAEVRELVNRIRTEHAADEVLVFLEAGAGVWVRLFSAAGATVHVVDPKQAKRFGESLASSGAKDDRRDAATLAELGRSARHRPVPWQAPREAEERLSRLSTRRERLVEERTRDVQRLREDLCLTLPLVEAVIEDFDVKWVRRVLRLAPTAWHLARVSRDELVGAMRGAHAATIARVAEAASRTEGPWLTEAVAEDEARTVRQALERIELIDQHVADADRAIDEVLAAVPVAQQVMEVDGIGRQLAAALVVFGLLGTGDRDAASVRMGASPVFRGSGKRRDGLPKGVVLMRKATAPRARQSTYLLGRLAVMHHDWAKRQYSAARHRGKKAATAYRQVARSFLRILYAMVRDGTAYDAEHYERALKARGVDRPEPTVAVRSRSKPIPAALPAIA